MKTKRGRRKCNRKVKYKNENQAYAAMRHLIKKNFIFHKIEIYYCNYCNNYHIGRSKKIFYDRFDLLAGKRPG